MLRTLYEGRQSVHPFQATDKPEVLTSHSAEICPRFVICYVSHSVSITEEEDRVSCHEPGRRGVLSGSAAFTDLLRRPYLRLKVLIKIASAVAHRAPDPHERQLARFAQVVERTA